MKTLVIKIGINALAVWAAAGVIGGITLSSGLGSVLVVAIIFGLVNAVLKPVALFLTFPVIILTLGLFTLVINAGMLLITDAISSALDVDGFGPAVLGAIVISLVSWAASMMLPDENGD